MSLLGCKKASKVEERSARIIGIELTDEARILILSNGQRLRGSTWLICQSLPGDSIEYAMYDDGCWDDMVLHPKDGRIIPPKPKQPEPDIVPMPMPIPIPIYN